MNTHERAAAVIFGGEIVDRRGEFTMHKLDELADDQLGGWADFVDHAWRLDYRGAVRYLYDRGYFQWLLGGHDWTATVILRNETQLAAVVVSLFRTLVTPQGKCPAIYSTSLTVAPEFRGAKLATWLQIEHRNRLFNDRAVVLGLAALHEHKAGVPSIASGVAADRAEVALLNLPSRHIWSMRLTDANSSAHGAPPGWEISRLRHADDAWLAEVLSANGCQAAQPMLPLPNASLFFDPAESLRRLYMGTANTRSGTILYRNDGLQCALSYSQVMVGVDDFELGVVAQLQIIWNGGFDSPRLEQALRCFATIMRQQGCMALSMVDSGVVPADVLTRLGFAASSDKVIFSLRGSPGLIEGLSKISPPYVFDFL